MSDFTELRKRWIEAKKQQRAWREAREEPLLWDLNSAINGLESLGWRRACNAPRDGTHFLVIEAGSTRVFPCSWRENSLRPEGGYFWIEASGDLLDRLCQLEEHLMVDFCLRPHSVVAPRDLTKEDLK